MESRFTKRIFIFILFFILVVVKGANLVVNPDFIQCNEKGNPIGWFGAVDPGSGIDREVTTGKGKNSYRIVGNKMIEQNVKIKPNTVYKFSYLLKTEEFEWLTAASFSVRWLDKGLKPLFRDYTNPKTKKTQKIWDMVAKNIQGTVNWKRFEFTAKSPATGAYANLRFGEVFQVSGKCYISNVCMSEVESGEPLENRVAAIPFLNQNPALDDSVFESEIWKNAAHIGDFLVPPAGAKTQNPTEVRIFYNDKALWVFFQCQQTAGTIEKENNRRYDSDNGIELFFLPPGASSQYHILAQPTGKIQAFTEKWNDGNWPMKLIPWKNNGIQSKIKLGNDRWSVVLRIPFAGMKLAVPADGSEWRANFCRYTFPAKEASAWAFLRSKHFQLTNYFGKIIFMRAVPCIESVNINSQGATVKVANPGKKEVVLTASFVEHDEKKASILSTDSFRVPAGKTVIQTLKRPTNHASMRYLEIRENGKLLMKHCNLPVEKYIALAVFDPENVRTQTLNIATDMRFFLNLVMQHNIRTDEKNTHKLIWRKDAKYDLIMALPVGIRLEGFMFDCGEWLQTDLLKPVSVKPVTYNGHKLNEYYFELPFIINRPADSNFKFLYSCNLKNDLNLTGYYYFLDQGKKMPEHEMKFRTIRVGKVKKQPKRFFMDIGLIDAKVLRYWFPKDTIRHYKEMGYNRLPISAVIPKNKNFYNGNNPKTLEDYYDIVLKEMKDSRDWIFLCSQCTSAVTPRAWQWTNNDPQARSINHEGKPGPLRYGYPSLCPSYRGKEYRKWIEQLPKFSVFSKYGSTWLDFDFELWHPWMWEKICFCPRCLKLFKEFAAKKGRPELAKLSIGAEIKKGANKELTALWNEFKQQIYSEFLQSAVDAVENTMKGNPSTSPLQKPFTCSEVALPNPQMKDGIFDYYLISDFYGSPDNGYMAMIGKNKHLLKRKDLYGCSTFGQTAGCPDFHLTPEQVKENLFEMAIFGFRGNAIYFNRAVEPLRQKMIIAGVNAIAPVEDIILDGDYMEVFLSSANRKIQLSARKYKEEYLLAVRAYFSSQDQTGKIRMNGITRPMEIFDCDTRQKIGSVTPEKPEFEINVGKGRCRLLYAGSEKQWNERIR